jgi:hypothetical protein
MLAAIELDDETALKTHEVDYVFAVWMLATEFAAFQLAPLQPLPQLPLGVRGRIAQSLLQSRFTCLPVGLSLHEFLLRRD